MAEQRELIAAAVGAGSRVAMLPADLACITGVDVAELLQRADEVAVGAVPDHTTRGTVAFTFRSVDVFAEFGRLSSPAARRLAMGLDLHRLLDVDVPADPPAR